MKKIKLEQIICCKSDWHRLWIKLDKIFNYGTGRFVMSHFF